MYIVFHGSRDRALAGPIANQDKFLKGRYCIPSAALAKTFSVLLEPKATAGDAQYVSTEDIRFDLVQRIARIHHGEPMNAKSKHLWIYLATGLMLGAGFLHAEESFYDIPAPGQRIDLGGYKLHLHCEGTGSPAVILEAGLGDWSSHWASVQKSLKTDTRVCSYDRAGYGWSDPGPKPRDSQRITEELHALLGKAKVEPPYILVGHSFGGLNVRLFASTYPEEVKGLVLVDASHPASLPYRRNEDGTTPSKAMTTGNQMMRVAPAGVDELNIPPEAQAALTNNLLHTKSVVTGRSEFRGLGQSVVEVADAPPLADVPLIVLSRGRRAWPAGAAGDAQEVTWRAQQIELSKLSKRGRQRIALNSGHHIHLDEPEVVADAVRELIQAK
jgi:pimeloyl-ACP methyl ester carboxylesterase